MRPTRTAARFFALLGAGAAFSFAGGTVFLAPLVFVGAGFGAAFAVAALAVEVAAFFAVRAVPSSRFRYFPVADAGFCAISSGVP